MNTRTNTEPQKNGALMLGAWRCSKTGLAIDATKRAPQEAHATTSLAAMCKSLCDKYNAITEPTILLK